MHCVNTMESAVSLLRVQDESMTSRRPHHEKGTSKRYNVRNQQFGQLRSIMVHIPTVRGVRYMQYAATLSATLSMTCVGLYTSWSSPILPLLTSSNSSIGTVLTHTEASLVASAFLLGYIPGGIASGWIVSHAGPKTTLLLSAVPTCVPWFFIVFAKSPITLCIARFVAGIGSSIGTTAVPIYSAEICDTDIRGKLGTTITIMYLAGCLFVLSIGPFVSYSTLAISCSIFPFIFLVSFWIMPESPYHLVKTNQIEAAYNNLVKLSAPHTEKKQIQYKLDEISRTIQDDAKDKSTFWELFTNASYRKPLIIATGIKTIQQFSGAAAIEVYMQTIIESSKSCISPQHSSIIFGSIQICTALLVAVLVDKLGRKPLFIGSALGCSVALSIEGIYFYLYTNAQHMDLDYISWLPTTGLVLFVVLYTLGVGTLPTIIAAEIFPTNIKSHALSFFTLFGGVLSVFVILLFNPISRNLGIFNTFFIFTTFCILGAIFIYIVLPETKGKTFAEIQASFYKS